MTAPHPSRRAQLLCAVALLTTTPLTQATPAQAIPAHATNPHAAALSCTSTTPDLATRLHKGIDTALTDRKGTIAVGVHDRTTGSRCSLRTTTPFDAASVVKVTVLAALLWDAQREGRALTAKEKSLTASMITKSSNTATDTLWSQLGLTKIRGFLETAEMTQTDPNPYGYWGLTQLTVRDQQRLTALLATPNDILTTASRSYALDLMSKVVKDQKWGTTAGAPSTVTAHVKNGWLPRESHGWRVHSSGVFIGGGRTYTITVLTHGNSSMEYGVTTIQRIARAVHTALTPEERMADRYEPTDRPHETIPRVP